MGMFWVEGWERSAEMGSDDKIIIMPGEQFSALIDVLHRLAPASSSVPGRPATASTTEDEAAAQIERVKVQILPDGRMDPKNAALYLNRKKKPSLSGDLKVKAHAGSKTGVGFSISKPISMLKIVKD
jgi:hypothetical protein